MKCQRKDGHYFEYDVETAHTAVIFPSLRKNISGGYIITPDGFFVPIGNGGLHYPDIQQYLTYYLNDLTVYENKNWIELVYMLNREGMVYTVASLNDSYQGHRLFSFPMEQDFDKMTDACKQATKQYIERVKLFEGPDFKLLYGSLEQDSYEKDDTQIMELLETKRR